MRRIKFIRLITDLWIISISYSLFFRLMFHIDYATCSFRKERTSHWHFSFWSPRRARYSNDSLPKTTNPERKRSEWMKRWMGLLMNEFTTATLSRDRENDDNDDDDDDAFLVFITISLNHPPICYKLRGENDFFRLSYVVLLCSFIIYLSPEIHLSHFDWKICWNIECEGFTITKIFNIQEFLWDTLYI